MGVPPVDVSTGVDEPDGTVGTTTLSVWAKATELPRSKDKLRPLKNKAWRDGNNIIQPLKSLHISSDGEFYIWFILKVYFFLLVENLRRSYGIANRR
ncbi:hypothetical protein DSM107003_26590 [Trichormus variabilis SAG 1403-4b]|uniref:Uncharacterized protein n=1 Tax=Trichormus variabilis SAG 1403-4b TaxID=447716 RepID=A0A3S5K351_ANAVA|nr:hypothetical protein DSM107003_26590 [Trichormus variabilis SAG 1403-4b]